MSDITQSIFVCNKNAEHYLTRISDTADNRLACTTGECEGWMYLVPEAAIAVPFQLLCFFPVGWRPVCVKHKQIFVFEGRYYREHAKCKGGTYPYSDLAIRSGYRKVWLP
jgi:hypothetical protein